jgi:putative transposase
MARRHRVNINEPFHAHELTFSCYQRFPFLKAERTCQWLVNSIQAARQQLNFALWGYVFMPDHVHLIVWPREADYDISQIRQAIKAPVARQAIEYLQVHAPEWLPRITRQRGQRTERFFWQSGGGYDRNIVNGKTLLSMLDYVHANPVRKGLVESPYHWRWSSAAWYQAQRPIPLAVDEIPFEWLEGT